MEGLGELPPLRADPERLRQVMSNIIDNSIKYTPAGGRVSIRGVHDHDSVTLIIADTGVGIPPDELTTVFEQFVRGQRRPEDPNPEGSGVGLAICRRIVRALGGKICASPGAEGGTSIQVTLPRWPDEIAGGNAEGSSR
jgi:two-component system clock-associated histidine kinase SasA